MEITVDTRLNYTEFRNESQNRRINAGSQYGNGTALRRARRVICVNPQQYSCGQFLPVVAFRI